MRAEDEDEEDDDDVVIHDEEEDDDDDDDDDEDDEDDDEDGDEMDQDDEDEGDNKEVRLSATCSFTPPLWLISLAPSPYSGSTLRQSSPRERVAARVQIGSTIRPPKHSSALVFSPASLAGTKTLR